MNTDPIADLLTRIRNASRAGKKTIPLPYSKVKENIVRILEEKAIIEKARVDRSGKFPQIVVTLKDQPVPISLKRISKPGQRVYIKAADIKPVKSGYGIAVISTSKGVMTGTAAKEKGMGGEYVCDVY